MAQKTYLFEELYIETILRNPDLYIETIRRNPKTVGLSGYR